MITVLIMNTTYCRRICYSSMLKEPQSSVTKTLKCLSSTFLTFLLVYYNSHNSATKAKKVETFGSANYILREEKHSFRCSNFFKKKFFLRCFANVGTNVAPTIIKPLTEPANLPWPRF